MQTSRSSKSGTMKGIDCFCYLSSETPDQYKLPANAPLESHVSSGFEKDWETISCSDRLLARYA
ncbi:hypothetical protein AUH73_03800 [archaeon 13_1_40CM_4_53_4]|nr:MAG: hypothetical protein AUH73_03800 [archaeon 13_1_40CM_4_53_4]